MVKIYVDCVKQDNVKYIEDRFSSFEIIQMEVGEFRDVIRGWANLHENTIHTCYDAFICHVGRFRRDIGESWLGEEIKIFAPEKASLEPAKYKEYKMNDKGQLMDWPLGIFG